MSDAPQLLVSQVEVTYQKQTKLDLNIIFLEDQAQISDMVSRQLQLCFSHTFFRFFDSKGRKRNPNNRKSIENACNRKNKERMTHRI